MVRENALPFDLWSLEVFIAVCEAGSMSAAAKRLGLTQPAISQIVGAMETATGTKLLDRKVKPIVPTAAGAIIRREAGVLLSEARALRGLLREITHTKLPVVRVGLVDSLVRTLSADLAAFLQSRSDRVAVYSGLTASHASGLLTRQLDMFIGVDEFATDSSLERWPILTEPYILALRKGTRPIESRADLIRLALEKPLARYSARSRTGADVERYLRRLGVDAPRSTEFDSPHGVAAMVRKGGWTITTPLCMYEATLSRDILYLPLPIAPFTRTLILISRTRELGRLPQQTATICRELLQIKVIPEIRSRLAWLNNALVVAIGQSDRSA